MKKRKRTTYKKPASAKAAKRKSAAVSAMEAYRLCAVPPAVPRVFTPEVNVLRASLIVVTEKKWVNGTVLHYYFFDKPTDGSNVFMSDGTTRFVPWTTSDAQKDVVRQAFTAWKGVGIGLEFQEVASRDEAEIRIGFMQGDGSWSYIGRDILDFGQDSRTMNIGWNISGDPDTAIHEIGHTLGFPHEHQNPNAGIVWNEEAVYEWLGGPPNFWDRDKTFYNIIRKIEPDTVQGSSWDANSIMHYSFKAGVIDKPEEYRTGINPPGGLSERDKAWVVTFYPALTAADYTELKPLGSVALSIGPGQQRNFIIQPTVTRYYDIRTFGESDTVMVLFEEENGELMYRMGDDDSGEDRNALLRPKLIAGRKYVLRIRLYYADRSGDTAVMMW